MGAFAYNRLRKEGVGYSAGYQNDCICFRSKQNFSRVARVAESNVRAVIFKNNKPKYLLIDLEQESLLYDLTDDEKVEIASRRIMKEFKPAFEELAK